MTFRLPLALALLAGSLPLMAEGWARGKGGLYANVSYARISSSTFYGVHGEKVPFPGQSSLEQRATLYLEYGLSDSFTVVASIPWKSLTANGFSTSSTTAGLADADLRLRHTWRLGSSLFLGLEAGATIPLGYRVHVFPALGTHQTDVNVDAGLAGALPFLPGGFFSADVGYRHRGGGVQNEIPFAFKVGAFPLRNAGLFAGVDGWKSTSDFEGVDPSFGFFGADSERLTGQLEGYVKLTERWHVNGKVRRILSGKNTVGGTEYSVGVAFQK